MQAQTSYVPMLSLALSHWHQLPPRVGPAQSREWDLATLLLYIDILYIYTIYILYIAICRAASGAHAAAFACILLRAAVPLCAAVSRRAPLCRMASPSVSAAAGISVAGGDEGRAEIHSG
jgi:hypothetical protein